MRKFTEKIVTRYNTGLSASTTYYYVVSADYQAGPDAGGESAYSSEASATTLTSAATFTLSLSPTSLSVAQGNQGTSTITTTVRGGFNSSIALSASGAPSGTTVNFSPDTIAAPGGGNSTMTLGVGSSTPVGSYPITVTGNGGGIQQSATLVVTATANFALAVLPRSETITRGKNGTYTVTVTASQGFSGIVTLNVSGLPPRASASFDPTSVTNSGSSTLTVHVGRKAPTGTTTLTITGSGVGLVRSTTATLAIQ